MKSYICRIFVAVILTAFLAAPAVAQPSSKSAVGSSSSQLLGTDYGVWETLNPLNSGLHTSQLKDLIFDVSVECGLMTRTNVKSSGGKKAGSVAEAGVMMRVLVDPEFDGEGNFNKSETSRIAAPGEVVFCQRTQELTATFGGILKQCEDTGGNLDGSPDGIITMDECTWTDEELELMLSTMTANAFNFTMTDLGAGDHKIVVQAKIDNKRCTLEVDEVTGLESYDCTPNTEVIEGDAKGWIGKGSMAVDEVRFTKDIILE